jgi:hypothetical protein
MGSVRRFVAPDVEVLGGKRSIMRGHLFVMMFRDRIGRAFSAALEHFRLFLKDFRTRHDWASRLSGQADEVDDRGGERGTDGPKGWVPAV